MLLTFYTDVEVRKIISKKIFILILILIAKSNLFCQETINQKNIYFPMDERLIENKTLLDSIGDTILINMFNKIPFYMASYIEKDFKYASKEHVFIAVDSISIQYPHLIELKSGYTPNIYDTPQKISYNRKTNLLDFTMDKKHGLISGDYVMIEIKDGNKLEFKVEDTPNEFTFSLKNNLPKSQNYFVRGKKIEDLKHIDSDELLLYSIRMNQLLYRKILELELNIQAIEAKFQKSSKKTKK